MFELLRFFQGKSNKVFTLEEFQKIINCSIGMLHIVLLVLFVYSNVWFMVGINVISILTYILAFKLSGPKHGILSFKIAFYEIIIHLVSAVIMVGNDCGFCMYMLAIIPVLYYFNYLFSQYEETKDKRFNPLSYSILCIILFIALRLYGDRCAPIYPFLQGRSRELLYAANYVLVAIALIGFMGAASVQFMTSKMKLMEYAMLDPLTGLVNRRSLMEVLNRDKKLNKEFVIILCDIDDFKIYNDKYGHEYGDIVLKEISNVLKKETRKNDIVCRWGGEEILIYLPDTKKEEGKLVTEKLQTEIKQIEIDGLDELVSMTFGIAESSEATGIDEIIRIADQRLYLGKAKGKDIVVWTEK